MGKNTLSPKTANINARVEKHLKAKAEKVLRGVGVRTSDAITMFLHQIVLHDGLPFEVKVPNAETRKAIAELESGKGTRFTAKDTDELFRKILGKNWRKHL
jgi:DNA-damage-inducible protein J